METKQLLDEYANSLLIEIGLPDNTDEAILSEMKSDILERLNNFTIVKALESLPNEKVEELNNLIEKGSNGTDAWNYVQKNLTNFEQFSINVMKEFRNIYLGKK